MVYLAILFYQSVKNCVCVYAWFNPGKLNFYLVKNRAITSLEWGSTMAQPITCDVYIVLSCV